MTSEIIEKEGYLLDVGYRNLPSGSAPYLHFSDANGDGGFSVFDTDFDPYFIVQRSNGVSEDTVEKRLRGLAADNDVTVQGVGHGWKKLHGDPVPVASLKVSYTGDVKKLRKKAKKLPGVVEVYEADIKFANRYITDTSLTPGRRYKVTYAKDNGHWLREITEVGTNDSEDIYLPSSDDILAFDLEIAKEGAFPTAEEDPIDLIAVSCGGEDTVIGGHDKTEEETIGYFCTLVQTMDPDIIVTYNGDDFDFPYIIERANQLDIPLPLARDGSDPYIRGASGRQGATNKVSVTGRLAIDLYKVVQRDYDKITHEDDNGVEINSRKTLENVAEFFGVMDYDERVNINAAEMYDVYHSTPQLFKDYAADDSRATLDIAMETLPQIVSLAGISRLPIEEAATIDRGKMTENYWIGEAAAQHEIVPNKQYDNYNNNDDNDDNNVNYEGAEVIDPIPGFHSNVTYLDFSSLYPNIMLAYNIGPDTLVDGDYNGNVHVAPKVGHRFRQDETSFLAAGIEKMLAKKAEIKERKKEATGREKKLLTSLYIATKKVINSFYGYLGWEASRWYNVACAESVTAWGVTHLNDIVDIANRQGFQVVMGDTDGAGVKETAEATDVEDIVRIANDTIPIELEIDEHYKTLFLLDAKKKYCGLLEDGTIKVKGLAVRRGDWAPYAQECQAAIISCLLREEDIEEAINEGQQLIERIDNREVDEEKLVMSSSLGQPLDEYDSKQKHSEAAKRAMGAIPGVTYDNGDSVPYVIVDIDSKGGVTDNTITVDHYHYGDFDIDYDYYKLDQCLPAIMDLLDVVNVDPDVVLGRPAQESLEEFL